MTAKKPTPIVKVHETRFGWVGIEYSEQYPDGKGRVVLTDVAGAWGLNVFGNSEQEALALAESILQILEKDLMGEEDSREYAPIEFCRANRKEVRRELKRDIARLEAKADGRMRFVALGFTIVLIWLALIQYGVL